MDPLSIAASVLTCYQLASEVGCQCLRYVRGVRQARKDADLVVAQIQIFQLSLHNLQGIIANEASNPKGGSRLKFLREIMDDNSASLMLCSKELEELRAKLVKAYSGGNLREVFHKLAWPLKQEEVDKAITALNNFAAAVDRGLAIDSNEVIREIDSTTKDINSATKQILISTESADAQQKQREKLRKDEEERKKAEKTREQILDWLTHPDPSEIHSIASRARKSSKTGRWLLNGTAFEAFRETPRSVLWLHGDSGCGKSVLCSAIIDELRALRSEEPKIRLAYWYFSVNDANRRSLQNLVRSLLTQVCTSSAAPPALLRLWEANRKGREAPQISDSIQTLVQMLVEVSMNEGRPKFFIVIDALDESIEAERTEIIDMLQRIVLLDIDVHLLITSRSNTVGVEQGLQDTAKLFNVVIERQNADEDILTHISERLEDDDDLKKWPLHLRKYIEEALVANAAGMFRWVDCQLQVIRRCRKPKELKEALTSLPKTLREVYAREVKNVEDRAVEDVRKLLGWMTYPQRPLRIEEAAEMLAVDLDSDPPWFDEGNRMPRPEDILTICGSLVRIDKNPEGRNSLGERAEVQTLTAAHASVVEFLKEERVQIGWELEISYTSAAVNLEMAETCLAYLLNFAEGKVVLDDDNIMNYPLARLSAELWDDFYREVVASSEKSTVDMTRVNTLVMRLFASPKTMLKWIQLCDPDHDTSRVKFHLPISYVKPVMYYAALLGLPDIVHYFITKRQSLDEMTDGGCGTPLVAACVYGRENIASILLENGADPNLPGNRYRGRPLAAAIEQNDTEIVKLLLRTKGVDVNARRYPFKSARTAQSNIDIGVGNTTTDAEESRTGIDADVGDLTLREDFQDNADTKDENLETQDTSYSYWVTTRSAESLLYIAAKSDSLEMVNALLEAGASPNIQGGYECTALQVACSGGSADIVETLLQHSANANIGGGGSGSPLQAACACPSSRTVKVLLGVAVDVNYVGREKPSALYLASVARDLEMVELLLEHGARTDIYGGLYDNSLQVASKNGDIAMVQALLNAGADVNRKGGRFGTALVSACRYKQTSVVAALLEHDADPNIQGCWECDNALQTACEQNNAQIVLLLLDHEANPNLHGGWYGSALHAAFSKGNMTNIQPLLVKGADVRYKGGEFHSVLHAAVESGNEAAVRLALDCGLSPNEKGGWFTYPLLRATAVENCPDSIVRLLLEEGADPNLEREGDDFIDHTFRTPLQHATSISKATLLMDAGAKVNTVSGWLGTALHVAIYAGGKQKSSMIKFLTERGADVNKIAENVGSPLCYAGREDDLDSAKLLIEAGADLDSVDTIGHSPLHMAICKTNLAKSGMELFDFFVDLGADPLLLDLRGCNGLHYAGRANHLGALKKILEREPDINATDNFGWTSLHWAAASTRKTAQVVKTLLDEGCNKDLKDKAERTALDLATMFDNTGAVAILKNDADTEPLDTDVIATKEPRNYECDGCGIIPDMCASEPWYKCAECNTSFDLCFRCIEDKDVIHARGHTWSDQVSTAVKWSV